VAIQGLNIQTTLYSPGLPRLRLAMTEFIIKTT
jgi:hypothetical protein